MSTTQGVKPGTTPTEVNLNSELPLPPEANAVVLWASGNPYPDPNCPTQNVRDVSASIAPFIGDGLETSSPAVMPAAGAVPAPIEGDAAANKFLHASGVFEVPPTMAGDTGSGGKVGYVPAPLAGSAALGEYLKADGTWAVPPGSLPSGAANEVLATPDGSSGQASLRKLVAADMPATGAGSGSVTSVGAQGDGVVLASAVSGSPVTTSGSLIFALASTVANSVLAGPTSGGSAKPTYRALIGADLPVMVGDSGGGGVRGAVPAPPSGSAAAGDFLRADGAWAVPLGLSATAPVQSVFGRTGAVVAASGDYTAAQVTGAVQVAGDLGNTAASPQVVSTHLSSPLPVAQGGSGTASPGLVAGSNVTVTGSWPNQTIAASGVAGSNGLGWVQQVISSSPASFGAATVYPAGTLSISSGHSVRIILNVRGVTNSGSAGYGIALSIDGTHGYFCQFYGGSPSGLFAIYYVNGSSWTLLCSQTFTQTAGAMYRMEFTVVANSAPVNSLQGNVNTVFDCATASDTNLNLTAGTVSVYVRADAYSSLGSCYSETT